MRSNGHPTAATALGAARSRDAIGFDAAQDIVTIEGVQGTQLLVTPLCGPAFPLVVRHHISPAVLSQQLAKRCNIPTSAFRLIFRGRYVIGATLGQLHRDETVRMVLRAPLRGGTVVKSGYLVKKPVHGHLFSSSRRRFFQLSESKLEWFADDESTGQPLGFVRLAGASIEMERDTLVVVAAGERLVLRGDALDEWATAIGMTLEKMTPVVGQLSADGESVLVEATLPAEVYRALSAFDDGLADVLKKAIIRLLRSEWLLAQPEGSTLPYRQQLEDFEQDGASPSPLLSPAEAVALLQQGDRSIGSVTHAWLSPGNPDPAGKRMQVVRQALKARPYIKAIFFECAHTHTSTRTRSFPLPDACQTTSCFLCTVSPHSTSILRAAFGRVRRAPFSAAHWT